MSEREWSCAADRRSVANLIRSAREAQGLTQSELARRMESSQSVIARWEAGDKAIAMVNLSRLAVALDITIAVRFGKREGDR
ncbi:helix-turn-helix domain-containing protein [Gordonia otitidis]|uniref:Xre family DNA binding protein n=1 Tax=Gordonia otitidis (strain DSM 44809 / CCUG 52243 / JCM 12355 / NBRC 100426 / IFM 10032) TaxID=1108044 RepID=H5TIG2_GORO1|nr:helix-turn-helix transcriptional regulator [Gordonia otitidis]GAB33270.1 putative Xre family DNA binding protein [Gordonia otitidis NBRC 100426]